MTWPPPYKLRRSKRAKRISLRILPKSGLEVVLPVAAAQKLALDFLNKNRAWVEKHANLLDSKNIAFEQSRFELPTTIKLRALENAWQVKYHYLPKTSKIMLLHHEQQLLFTGNTIDFEPCVPLVKDWLKGLAGLHLMPWLESIAERCQLKFNRIAFRSQKTLWGSCSAKHHISLNYKLLFLPPALIDYVMIHELCHTLHFNHSKIFWKKVASFDPEFKKHERELREADQYVPKWYS